MNCPKCQAALEGSARFCQACGSPASPISPLSPPGGTGGGTPPLPARYQVVRFLGRGGMGRVYLCRDSILDVEVAVKVLPAEVTHDEEALAQIGREAKAAARFRDCAGILSLHGFEQHGETWYLVMEYAGGGSIHDRIKAEGTLPERECRRLGAEVAEALAFAHERNILHRDVKPANILLDGKGRAKVADFGIAKVMSEASSRMSLVTVAGTPVYMAPEIILQQKVDGRADLYSLGCMLYEMSTGKRPYTGSYTEIAMAKTTGVASLPDPRALRPDLSEEFGAIVLRLLSIRPEDRFPDGRACAAALRAEAAAPADAAATLVPPAPAPSRRSRGPWFAAAGIAAAAVAAFLAYPRPKIEEPPPVVVAPKPAPVPDPVPEPKPEPKPEPSLAFAPEPAPDPVVEPVPEPKPEPVPEPEPVAPPAPPAPTPPAPTPPPPPVGAAVPGLEPPPEDAVRAQKALAALPEGLERRPDGRIFSRKDGAELVLLPAGEFARGGLEKPEERPVRTIFVSAFLMDRHEVTNGQFARFVRETGHRTDAEKDGKGDTLVGDTLREVAGADWAHPTGPSSSIEGMDVHPVVLVSWNDAKAYADWAGRRLPTEAEFEKALRGGLSGMEWPWGKGPTPNGKFANYSDGTGKAKHRGWSIVPGYSDGFEHSSPAGSFAPNAFGLFDVAGNAWEWCADWFDPHGYAGSPERDPRGPSSGTLRVVRGGGWFGAPAYLRAAYRERKDPADRDVVRGFRLARTP